MSELNKELQEWFNKNSSEAENYFGSAGGFGGMIEVVQSDVVYKKLNQMQKEIESKNDIIRKIHECTKNK